MAALLDNVRDVAARVLGDASLATFGRDAVKPVVDYSVKSFFLWGEFFSASPAAFTAGVMLLAANACYQMNVWTRWWSGVDRCWSVLPPLYALAFALAPASPALIAALPQWLAPTGGGAAGAVDPRLALMAALVTLWGARLTRNFARKGGYSAGAESEDYRWPVLRGWIDRLGPGLLHDVAEQAFSLLFVAYYQQVLIWLFVVPPLYVAQYYGGDGKAPLGARDALLGAAFLALLALESWADETQWAFQQAKHAMAPAERARAGGDFARGFCTQGPFAISRHLNFFAEQSMWVVFYLFSWAAGAPALNWSGLGALLLIGLFQGSTWMTELLTAQRYPMYAAYQRTTSRLLPWVPGPSLDSAEGKLIARGAVAAAEAAAPAAPKGAAAGKRRQSVSGGKRE